MGLQVHLENGQCVLNLFPLFSEGGHFSSQAGKLGVDLLVEPFGDLIAPRACTRQRRDPGLLALLLHLRQFAVECLLLFHQGRVALVLRIQDVELCLEIGGLLFHAGQIGPRAVIMPGLVAHLGRLILAGVVLDLVGVSQVVDFLGPGGSGGDEQKSNGEQDETSYRGSDHRFPSRIGYGFVGLHACKQVTAGAVPVKDYLPIRDASRVRIEPVSLQDRCHAPAPRATWV